MGTRCLTIILDKNEKLCNFYRQYDGYPEGHGKELFELLKDKTLVNGFGFETKNQHNGMGCLAASLIAHFKTDIGGFYLYPVNLKDVGEEFIYELYSEDDKIYMSVTDVYEDKELFNGDIKDYNL